MSLLTLFTSPKPFTDPHIDIIQRNAIQSWLHLGSDIQILIIGDEPGAESAAREYNIKIIPEVMRNDSGTPLISSIFDLAHRHSQTPFLGYANADILLLPDLPQAVRVLADKLEKFLLIGQRWDLDLQQSLDFSPGWDINLRSKVSQNGALHLPAGSDYFIFPRSLFSQIPDFAVGRAGWDNWMIFHAKQKGFTVVDGTPDILVIHQNHDYRHFPNGKPHYQQEESQLNQDLAGGTNHLYMVLDSDVQLRNHQLRSPRISIVWLLRRLEVHFASSNGKTGLIQQHFSRRFRRMRRRITGSL